MLKRLLTTGTTIVVISLASAAWAQSSSSWVDVGRGHADAGASYDGNWGIAESESRVGAVNLGRGLAVGVGPNGLTLSHSIGVRDQGGVGIGHNFNLAIGPNGSHVGHGGVVTAGPNSRVITGGNTEINRYGARGSNYAGGTGRYTNAWSDSRTTPPRYQPRFRSSRFRR